MLARQYKKNDSPSPTSYNYAKSLERSAGNAAMDKSGRFYKIGTSKKESFTEKIMAKSKKLPGVGQYNSHSSLDKVSRPYMKSYK